MEYQIEKDSDKINNLAEINKESIDKLAEKAVQSAKSTKEDSELIAKVVAVASDEIANKVVEEVKKNKICLQNLKLSLGPTK